MALQWVKRKSHVRYLPRGGTTFVRSNWALRQARSETQSCSYRHHCPDCGAEIISVGMKRGGWVHFEGARGLSTVKHSCLHRGEHLGKVRDDETLDLFDARKDANNGRPS